MKHFPHVDLLRAVAVILVLVYHLCAIGGLQLSAETFWSMPLRYGWIGVDLFLVISGFVITLSALRASDTQPVAFKWPFMQRRFRRLLPLYVLTCLVFVLLVKPEVLSRPTNQLIEILISHVFFVSNLSPRTHGVINGVTWSLALEMQFYVALIFSIHLFKQWGALRTGLILIGLSWLWRFATTLILIPGQATPHLQVIYTTQLPGTLDAFGVGIVLALAIHQKTRFSTQWLYAGGKPFVAWSLISASILSAAAWQMQNHAVYWSHHAMIIFWRTLLAMGFGAALAAAITCPVKAIWLKPLHYLGEISYGIYLWHFLVLLSLLQLTTVRAEPLLLTVLVGAIILSSASWHLMEKNWIQKRQA